MSMSDTYLTLIRDKVQTDTWVSHSPNCQADILSWSFRHPTLSILVSVFWSFLSFSLFFIVGSFLYWFLIFILFVYLAGFVSVFIYTHTHTPSCRFIWNKNAEFFSFELQQEDTQENFLTILQISFFVYSCL